MLIAEMVEGLYAGPVTGIPWGGAAIVGRSPAGLGWGEEEGEEASSISITCPNAEIYSPDTLHGRLGLVGGQLARCWWAFTHGGINYVVTYQQGGSGADPTEHVASLSGYTVITVDLGSVYRDGSAVASLSVTAINTELGTSDASADGAALSIDGASDLEIPPDVDTTDMTLSGMAGVIREIHETSIGITQANTNGGTNATSAQHVQALSGRTGFASARACRPIALYCAGHGGWRPLLGIGGLGTADSMTPGTFTMFAEARLADGLANGEIGLAPIAAVPAGMDTDDTFWFFTRGDTATSPGGSRVRQHGRTREFNGDFSLGNGTTTGMLLVDNAADDAATTSFGSSYAFTVSSSFGFYLTGGIVFEVADANGRYPANGRFRKRFGSHMAENQGTQFIADGNQLDDEVTAHRFLFPEYQYLTVNAIGREYDTVAATEDSRAAFYQFDDLAYPSTTAAVLLADLGPTGPASGEITRTEVTAELGMTNVDRVSGDWCALAWNYVPANASGDWALPVYLDEAAGDDSWVDMWIGSQRSEGTAFYRGHTSIPMYSGRIRGGGFRAPSSDANEYRSINIAGMPHDTILETYPDPWVTDATDDTPSADANEYVECTMPGFAEAA